MLFDNKLVWYYLFMKLSFSKEAWSTIADLLVNLSAGWIGAAFITSSFTSRSLIVNLAILTADIGLAILSLQLAIIIRKQIWT